MPVIKKKLKARPPAEIVPYNSNNKNLSKKDFVAQENKRRAAQAAAKIEYDKIMGKVGESKESDNISSDSIESLELQLETLSREVATAETMASSPEAEAEVIEKKKAIRSLQMRIGKAKKKLDK